MAGDHEHETDEARAGYLVEHPIASAMLVASILLGALLGLTLISEDLSATRRLLGGGLAGGGSWLLVMMGRAIG